MRYYPTRLDHPWMLCVFSNDFFLSLCCCCSTSPNAMHLQQLRSSSSGARGVLQGFFYENVLDSHLSSGLLFEFEHLSRADAEGSQFRLAVVSFVQIKSSREAKKRLIWAICEFHQHLSLTYFIITGNKTAISSIYISVRYEKDVMQHNGKKSHFICSKNPSRASIDPRPIVVSCETTS